ncbi:hypothetical protein LMH73_029105 [Vibrio splendidus]|nr:hypothetical protein [Vibrio splendidus]
MAIGVFFEQSEKLTSDLDFHSIMYDVLELLSIYNGLNSLSDENLVETLQVMVGGRVRKGLLVGDERARNFEFELKIISHYNRPGFNLDLSTNTDLIVENYQGTRVLIECKRLTSSKKLEKRIKEASKQLNKKYKSHGGTKGIIYLDVTNLINTNFKLIKAETTVDAENFIRQKIEEFAEKHHHLWCSIENIKTVGVILYLSLPAEIGGKVIKVLRVHHAEMLIGNPEEKPLIQEFFNEFVV